MRAQEKDPAAGNERSVVGSDCTTGLETGSGSWELEHLAEVSKQHERQSLVLPVCILRGRRQKSYGPAGRYHIRPCE